MHFSVAIVVFIVACVMHSFIVGTKGNKNDILGGQTHTTNDQEEEGVRYYPYTSNGCQHPSHEQKVVDSKEL